MTEASSHDAMTSLRALNFSLSSAREVGVLSRMFQSVLNRPLGAPPDLPRLTTTELLTCCVYRLLSLFSQSPDELFYLLKQLQPALSSLADDIDEATSITEIDPLFVVVADNRFFTWTGRQQFLDIINYTDLEELEQPAVTTVQLDIVAAIHRLVLNRISEHDHGTRESESADPAPEQ